jgi:hypothetical protein
MTKPSLHGLKWIYSPCFFGNRARGGTRAASAFLIYIAVNFFLISGGYNLSRIENRTLFVTMDVGLIDKELIYYEKNKITSRNVDL